MDIYSYLLEGVVESTTPPGETVAQTNTRRDAIGAMFASYDPDDGMEAMIVCHCIELQFLLKAAIRDAGNTRLDADRLGKARAGAMALSKTWNQWVTKLEKMKHRKHVRATEALKAAQTNAAAGVAPVAEPRTAKPAAVPPSKAPADSAPPEAVPEEPPELVVFQGVPDAVVAAPASVRPPGLPPSGISPGTPARPNLDESEALALYSRLRRDKTEITPNR
jgi:hypothetical protein